MNVYLLAEKVFVCVKDICRNSLLLGSLCEGGGLRFSESLLWEPREPIQSDSYMILSEDSLKISESTERTDVAVLGL